VIPDDKSIGAFLSARRKTIMGVLAFASVLTSSALSADLAIQALFALLGVYGVHEVAND
jgi:hypothetical protein